MMPTQPEKAINYSDSLVWALETRLKMQSRVPCGPRQQLSVKKAREEVVGSLQIPAEAVCLLCWPGELINYAINVAAEKTAEVGWRCPGFATQADAFHITLFFWCIANVKYWLKQLISGVAYGSDSYQGIKMPILAKKTMTYLAACTSIT